MMLLNRVYPFVLFALVLVLLGGPEPAGAHGVGGSVPNHHKWVNMAVACETKGIVGRWSLGPSHPRWNGHDGALQFAPSTWTATVANYPKLRIHKRAYLAPPWKQIAAAELLRKKAGMGQWSCHNYWR